MLILQCMCELVRQNRLLIVHAHPVQHIHGLGFGVVIRFNLLGEQSQQKGLEGKVAVQQAELLQHDLVALHALGAFVLIELFFEVPLHLGAAGDLGGLTLLLMGERPVSPEEELSSSSSTSEKSCLAWSRRYVDLRFVARLSSALSSRLGSGSVWWRLRLLRRGCWRWAPELAWPLLVATRHKNAAHAHRCRTCFNPAVLLSSFILHFHSDHLHSPGTSGIRAAANASTSQVVYNSGCGIARDLLLKIRARHATAKVPC